MIWSKLRETRVSLLQVAPLLADKNLRALEQRYAVRYLISRCSTTECLQSGLTKFSLATTARCSSTWHRSTRTVCRTAFASTAPKTGSTRHVYVPGLLRRAPRRILLRAVVNPTQSELSSSLDNSGIQCEHRNVALIGLIWLLRRFGDHGTLSLLTLTARDVHQRETLIQNIDLENMWHDSKN